MNKDEKIKQLVDRFMAGETSLDVIFRQATWRKN